jgi:hypothetical protein
MRDPFCSTEVLDSGMERLVALINCGHYDRDDDEQNALLDYEPQTVVWRNPNGREVVIRIPPNVRGTPKGTRIEIKYMYRGFYVGEGIMIAKARLITSFDPNHLFERVWVPCNPHRVRIEPEWEVSIIS